MLSQDLIWQSHIKQMKKILLIIIK
uniref:Uncharacterized protein n=1 Tax=Arundo donax TaxID=35708 RepID=A0A0A8ZDU7_ARUDO